jgi:chromosome segregation ATPase
MCRVFIPLEDAVMDINQAARMIEWLDEERRRDKATIATLEERLAQQQETISTLGKRINSMESDQTVIRTQITPSGRETDLIDQVRKEMLQLIETVEAKRLTAEREAERRLELGRESTSRPLRELTEKLEKLERQTSTLPGYQVERERVSDSVATLQQRVDDLFKKIEEPDRRLAFLEEQRRQDSRRVSEVQSEVPEMKKQVDSIRPKLTLLEDLALRTERRVQDVQNSERERREQIQQFIDQQTLVIQQRDQQIADLVKRFGEQDSVMQRNIERFETWSEAYRGMKKIIDDFERIGDRLERRINEVAEMQRLSEERFRQEWNDWTADDQKRWKQFTISNDEVWRSHDKEFDRFVQKITELEAMFPPISDSLNRIWNLERERAQLYRERYQSLLLEFDSGAKLPSPKPVAPVNGSSNPPG